MTVFIYFLYTKINFVSNFFFLFRYSFRSVFFKANSVLSRPTHHLLHHRNH